MLVERETGQWVWDVCGEKLEGGDLLNRKSRCGSGRWRGLERRWRGCNLARKRGRSDGGLDDDGSVGGGDDARGSEHDGAGRDVAVEPCTHRGPVKGCIDDAGRGCEGTSHWRFWCKAKAADR